MVKDIDIKFGEKKGKKWKHDDSGGGGGGGGDEYITKKLYKKS